MMITTTVAEHTGSHTSPASAHFAAFPMTSVFGSALG